MSTKVHRAVLSRDASGIVRVLATDSDFIAHQIDIISSDATDLGIVDDLESGIWLWIGTVKTVNAGYHDQPDEYETEYKGELVNVLDPSSGDLAYIADLLAIHPPDEFDETDRDSPGT